MAFLPLVQVADTFWSSKYFSLLTSTDVTRDFEQTAAPVKGGLYWLPLAVHALLETFIPSPPFFGFISHRTT